MLATGCVRVLGYRDSYLLFNKNRTLHKLIATQAEKDDLIQREILSYSHRSRQIAIVNAKSIFRQFGSRVVEADDVFETIIGRPKPLSKALQRKIWQAINGLELQKQGRLQQLLRPTTMLPTRSDSVNIIKI